MKNILNSMIFLISLFIFSGCSLLQKNDKSIITQENGSPVYRALGDKSKFSEIICSDSDQAEYPNSVFSYSSVSFKKRESRFAFSYRTLKFPSGKRDITLFFRNANKEGKNVIKDFPFEESTKYIVKHISDGTRYKFWIEKEDGTIVLGIKPKKI